MPVTQAQLDEAFKAFDQEYFEGQLVGGTTVTLEPKLAGAETDDGDCSRDGKLILISPRDDHNWECTLLHEMVHAQEYRFPGAITPSDEGRAASKRFPRYLYGEHSPEFFTKLLEVMRRREHHPETYFSDYFG